jgi:hypothetical protein
MSLPGFDKTLGLLTLRKQAYQQTFNKESVAVQRVLKDLAKFCRANITTFHPDSRMHAHLEGRREVWLRITQHLQLTPEELLKILGG